MSASNWTHVTVDEIEFMHVKAMKVRIKKRSVWIPYTLMADSDDPMYKVGAKKVMISVEEWFAKKENLC